MSAATELSTSGLCAGQAQMLDGLVVKAERIFGRARALDGEQCGQGGFVSGEASADPGGERLGGGGSACFPGVNGVDWGGCGGF